MIWLVLLIFGGWSAALFGNNNGGKTAYNNYIKTAEEYVKRGLYQKAIIEYDSALSIKNTEELWSDKLNAYEKYYEENSECYSNYLSAVQSAVNYYEKNIDYLVTLTNLYINQSNYDSAYKVLNDAVKNGINDNEINDLLQELKYSFKINWKSYVDFRTNVNGLYAVRETGVWTYIKEDGTGTKFENLIFAGPVGVSGIRVVQDNTRAYLIDSKQVIQGILNFEPTDAGVYSEGLVPIAENGVYRYYNALGDEQFGQYDYAGTFINGQAAVKQGNTWFLINSKGEKISDRTYEDIILQLDGSHLSNGTMVAKKNGQYHLYVDDKEIGNYDDIDIVTDDNLIAFCQKGKWGFIDLDGIVKISPTYIEAKSFSNGLAAVSDGTYWGFINKEGKLVIDYMFYGADYFNSEGRCMVETGAGTNYQLITLNIR